MDAVVLTCVLVIFAATFSNLAYVPLAPFLASETAVGVLLSSQGFASCLALVPSGWAVDRLGSEYVLRLGSVVFALSLMFSSVSAAFLAQLLGRLCNGAGGSMLFCSAMAMIMERFQDPVRAEYVGVSLGLGTVGGLAGPPAAGYIFALAMGAGAWAPQALALAPTGVMLALAYAALLRVPKADFSPKEPLLESGRGQEGLCPRLFGVYAAVGAPSWVISLALACLFGAQGALLCGGALAMQAQGFTARDIGLVPVPAGFMQALFSRWGGRMAGTPRQRISIMVLSPLSLAAGLLCCPALARCIPPGGAVLPVALAVGACSAAMAAADAPSISLMSELAARHGRGYGEAMTASEFAVCGGQAIGPSLGVWLLQWGGFDGLCLVPAACAALVSIACATFLRHEDPSPECSAA
mmetsp:Transcript_78872/g.249265  ORF Transcript_78872/g.249265 Transcript_78872/m.249265 type:complete len:411 (-) Transcript_78872:26-1258(-)